MSEIEEMQRRLKLERDIAQAKAEVEAHKKAAASANREIAELHMHHSIQQELMRAGLEPDFAAKAARIVMMETKFREVPEKGAAKGAIKLEPASFGGKEIGTVPDLVKACIKAYPYLGPDQGAQADGGGAQGGAGGARTPKPGDFEKMSANELAELGLQQHENKQRVAKPPAGWKDLPPAEMAQLAWSTPPSDGHRGSR